MSTASSDCRMFNTFPSLTPVHERKKVTYRISDRICAHSARWESVEILKYRASFYCVDAHYSLSYTKRKLLSVPTAVSFWTRGEICLHERSVNELLMEGKFFF